MGCAFYSSIPVQIGLQELAPEMAVATHFKNDDALLLPHLVLPQRKVMETT
jgi:hypothetical protein